MGFFGNKGPFETSSELQQGKLGGKHYQENWVVLGEGETGIRKSGETGEEKRDRGGEWRETGEESGRGRLLVVESGETGEEGGESNSPAVTVVEASYSRGTLLNLDGRRGRRG